MTVKDVKGMKPGEMPCKTKFWVDETLARKILVRCRKEHLFNRKINDLVCDKITHSNPYDTQEITCMTVLKFIKDNETLKSQEEQHEDEMVTSKHSRAEEKFMRLHERLLELLEEEVNAA